MALAVSQPCGVLSPMTSFAVERFRLLESADTPALVRDLVLQARQDPRRVVLADVDDPRIEAARAILSDLGVAVPVDPVAPSPSTDPIDGLDQNDPLTQAVLMVANGQADACIAGASRPSAEVLRAGLRGVGRAGEGPVSSCFVLVLPDGQPVAFADCAVLPDPNSEQLAHIARSSANTYRELTGREPRVAMLSFSTHRSADHAQVDKVRSALASARAAEPNLIIDGELQFDAAWVPEVGRSKAPHSKVAGRANVFVFPNLDAANAGYKIAQRLGGARAFGPLLQGLSGIVHDLSRGCTTEDVVMTTAIAVVQAQRRARRHKPSSADDGAETPIVRP